MTPANQSGLANHRPVFRGVSYYHARLYVTINWHSTVTQICRLLHVLDTICPSVSGILSAAFAPNVLIGVTSNLVLIYL